jgi:aldehyde dehydrogenase (NAD+)
MANATLPGSRTFDRLDNARNFYIDGKWIRPAQYNEIDVINPATKEPIERVAMGSALDVDCAVAAASKAFETYQYTSRAERIALFDRIIESFRARHADLARTVTAEIGSPFWFSDEYQVEMGLAHFVEARRLLENYPFEYRLGANVIRREAFGVCGLISAWNWPVQLVTSKVAPALAAGCTMVLKPSELAPLSGVILAEIMDAAGVPPGVFNLVNGDGVGVGQAISSHPGIDLISFTGSTRAGVAISKAAADTVKSVHLELGGKSANIILDDADLEVAIPDAVRRGFFNSGQSCIAPTRLLVQERQMEQAVAIARSFAETLTVGDPLSEGTRLGPSANAAQFGRVQEMIRSGIDQGATLVCGGLGTPLGLNGGFFVKPTIFSRVTPNMKIAQEEIFGPVLSVLSYTDEADAIAIANGTPYGLAGYVSSGDPKKAQAVATKMRAGRIFINGAPQNVEAPFGGYKKSGNGREWGVFGLETFLEVKAVLGQAE